MVATPAHRHGREPQRGVHHGGNAALELVEATVGLTRVVPPLARRWFELLPSPWKTEKPVVAILIPMDWTFMEGATKDDKYKVMVAMSADEEKCLGLQLVDVNLKTVDDHQALFEKYNVRTPDPAYIGPISRLPNRLLLDEDMTCLIFSRDEFWRRPIDLKRVWTQKPVEQKC
jgi:hypothetical protein